eukprot:GILJ01001220.1.p1 GENE.GILJ01001220.1~~GILJ01001220.1.p1  ORF type:complete len:463 (-),score=96.05 GILJ01001220.1:133-1521(-)
MSYLNIPSTNTDPSYRYRMPRLQTKIEGRGNGIKTVLINVADVARSLKRPIAYPTKFFGSEIGAMSKYDPKEDRSIVNGAHEAPFLQGLLDKFIEKFVLCPRCGLPETDLEITKKGLIYSDCKACGAHEPADMAHKFSTFILKNPPEGAAQLAKKTKLDRAERQALRAEQQRKAAAKDGDEQNDEVDMDSPPEEQPTVARKSKSKDEKRPKKTKKTGDEQEDDVPSPEPQPEANGHSEEKKKKKKKKTLSDEMAQLTVSSPEVKDLVLRLSEYLNAKPRTVQEVWEEVRLLQISQDFDNAVKMHIFVSAFFGEPIAAQLPKKLDFLKKFIYDKEQQMNFLWALEIFTKEHPTALKHFPVMLKTLYDNDLLDEEVAIEWYNTPNVTDEEAGKLARATSAPFVEWLQTAEDEEDDEEEDEEEEEEPVKPTPKQVVAVASAPGAVSAPAPPASAKEEEDFNIDDI